MTTQPINRDSTALLTGKAEKKITYQAAMHGTLVIVNEKGILLTGRSGIGKTALALHLIDRDHQLVADDLVNIHSQPRQLIGSCPSQGLGLIHHKQLGIIDIRRKFGPTSVQRQYAINCIVELTKNFTLGTIPMDIPFGYKTLYDHRINHVELSITPFCNLAILIELITDKMHENQQLLDT